jgi:putative zinc finger/helix-turn-helix YgiT family protein
MAATKTKRREEVKIKKCYDCRAGTMHGTRTYYHYTECGLDCVTLENVIVYRCSACGAIVPEIPAIGELHRKLVLDIVNKPNLLSGQEIKFLRKMAGLSGKDLAVTLGVSASTVSRWENGSRNISKNSDAALRMICFAGMLQDILRDRVILPTVMEATRRLSTENIRDILAKVVNRVTKPVPVTIDPHELVDLGQLESQKEVNSVPVLQ